jgi:arylsulfatase I/J
VSGFAAIPRNMTGIAAKMAAGGYATHMAGKWDAGMATPDHTPQGRGYASSLNYFQHANDYWTSIDGQCKVNKTTNVTTPIVDLWDTDKDGRKYNQSWNCSQDNQLPSCIYEDEVG